MGERKKEGESGGKGKERENVGLEFLSVTSSVSSQKRKKEKLSFGEMVNRGFVPFSSVFFDGKKGKIPKIPLH